MEDHEQEEREFHDDEDEEKKKKKLKEKETSTVASHVMTSPVITLFAEMTLEEAAQLVQKWNFRHLPVISNKGILLGVLSDRELLKYLGNFEISKTKKVKDIMDHCVLCATADTNIRKLAQIFFDEDISMMPIVNAKNEVEGIITRKDLFSTIIKIEKMHLLEE